MFYLALRQLLSRKKQTFLIFLGVSFGTMVYVLIAGVQLGMREYLAEQLLNNTAHIRISGRERPIIKDKLTERFFSTDENIKWIVPPSGKRDEARLENPGGWFERLSQDPEVISYAPRLVVNALATRGKINKSISITGVIPARQIEVSSLEDYMKEGSLLELRPGGHSIVLASGVMDKLGARIGESISISLGTSGPRHFKIVGKVRLGNQQFDDVIAFAHLSDIQAINKTPGRVGEIAVALVDMNKSDELADQWSLFTVDKVESWKEANASFMQIIAIQDAVRYVITVSILLVAGFGIYNVLSIMINQKQKEIAILRSIGYSPRKIFSLFLIQGLLLGFVGALIGLSLGFGLNILVERYDLGFDIGKGSHLIVSFEPSIYITAFVAAQVSAILASFFPSYHASKLTPLEIIRSNL